jgi:anaerobic magnesium-protoporphyrin IX monomethyl ester cyclase
LTDYLGDPKKVHITLVNPPQTTGAPNSGFVPLGIGYLAAVLEEGYAVDVIDCQVQQHTPRELESELSRIQPDIIGITSTTLTYRSATDIVQTAKKACPNSLIIMGGPHVTVLDEQTLNEQPEVDIIVRGEGERTLLEIADLVTKSSMKDLNRVSGITFRKNGQIVQTVDRPFIQNIDELPYPAFKHFDVSKYRIFGKTYLPVITSRGCPFQCTFCLASKMCGRGFRARSPKNVVDELEFLRDNYGADAFSFYDDTFTFDRKRARDICKEMKNRKVDLQWDCRTRVDRISKEDLLVLRNANCQLIHFGVESGSQKMLNLMKKGTTVEQNARAIKWAKEAGISVAISVVVGYPGETPELLQETLNFIYKTRPDYVYMCVAIPYPGTEMYNYLNELGWEMSPRWDHYDEQTVVFKNPLLSSEQIAEMQRTFFNKFFSLSYLLRQSVKRDFYSKIMARSALNHILWRVKLPRLISATFKKLPHKQKDQQEA